MQQHGNDNYGLRDYELRIKISGFARVVFVVFRSYFPPACRSTKASATAGRLSVLHGSLLQSGLKKGLYFFFISSRQNYE
jgi:hypothetical protein